MDRYWNVLMTNESAPRFFNCFIDMSQRKGPRNMLHLVFDPNGMRPFVEHWDEVASSLIHRVRTEATGRVIDDKATGLGHRAARALGVVHRGAKRYYCLSLGFGSYPCRRDRPGHHELSRPVRPKKARNDCVNENAAVFEIE
jgi:hypothetical protein